MQKSDFTKHGIPDKFAQQLLPKCGKAASQGYTREQMKQAAKEVGQTPENVSQENPFKEIAKDIAQWRQNCPYSDPAPHYMCGEGDIEQKAVEQFLKASSLNIIEQSALMPDAHFCQGGVPVGSVLKTEDKVIPGAVGYDISCMMKLTVFDVDWEDTFRPSLINTLKKHTFFGVGSEMPDISKPCQIIESSIWNKYDFLKENKKRIIRQLGSSGSSNHFADFGAVDVDGKQNKLALLTHSGSRALGAGIASKYQKIANKKSGISERQDVPTSVKNLGWLNINSQKGEEYWELMKFASKYADYCHRLIHSRIETALELNKDFSIENKHNIANIEQGGVVHRKGATPAYKGNPAIIPGSMTESSYIIEGVANKFSKNKMLKSVSHGAGRSMSRSEAKSVISNTQFQQHLIENNVQNIGGDIDEHPNAYKDLDDVMKKQNKGLNIIGEFKPKVVRMAKD